MKKFALIGAAGFVAERHIKAIKETINNLVVAADDFDVMGRMDSYFPEADFFTDFDRFADFVKNIQASSSPIDYCSICTPNFRHRSHIEFALNNGMDAICEKPLVLYPEDIIALEKLQQETGKKVYNILQLRHHPVIKELRSVIKNDHSDKIYDIDLTYITSRGKWYFKSWKTDVMKSGGIATNIGIHFFDMLIWIFGSVKESVVHISHDDKASGFLQLEKARVRWFLSLDYNDIPTDVKEKGMRTFRSIMLGGEEIEFSEGFANLHTETYKNILSGNGFGLDDAKPCIQLAHQIRNSAPVGLSGDLHPYLMNGIFS